MLELKLVISEKDKESGMCDVRVETPKQEELDKAPLSVKQVAGAVHNAILSALEDLHNVE